MLQPPSHSLPLTGRARLSSFPPASRRAHKLHHVASSFLLCHALLPHDKITNLPHPRLAEGISRSAGPRHDHTLRCTWSCAAKPRNGHRMALPTHRGSLAILRIVAAPHIKPLSPHPRQTRCLEGFPPFELRPPPPPKTEREWEKREREGEWGKRRRRPSREDAPRGAAAPHRGGRQGVSRHHGSRRRGSLTPSRTWTPRSPVPRAFVMSATTTPPT